MIFYYRESRKQGKTEKDSGDGPSGGSREETRTAIHRDARQRTEKSHTNRRERERDYGEKEMKSGTAGVTNEACEEALMTRGGSNEEAGE